ncbi:hypothetical protein JG688_00006824 [Phytophthora aleatoria]|uniref:Uncharacterized protein n=1 Tax=Phytophthora aleatoria TaxID=2496075 RepID=A0A8J5IQ91_9STRA|nr:hypothetical protein JG688_00006824 [Phytophthora aleatoria]
MDPRRRDPPDDAKCSNLPCCSYRLRSGLHRERPEVDVQEVVASHSLDSRHGLLIPPWCCARLPSKSGSRGPFHLCQHPRDCCVSFGPATKDS